MLATARAVIRSVVVIFIVACTAPLGLAYQDQETPEHGTSDPETQHQKNDDVPPGGGGPGEGDPVDAATGAFSFRKKMLEIPGRGMNFDLSLQYLSSAAGVETNTGARWTHDYEQRLMLRYSWSPPPTPYDGPDKPGIGLPLLKWISEATQVPHRVLHIDVYYFHDLFVDHFQWDASDRTNWIPTSRGFDKLKSTNVASGPYQIPQSFVLRKRDGTKLTFPSELLEGGCGIYTVRLGSIEDRLGNRIALNYETKRQPSGCPTGEGTFYRRLSRVDDTFGRPVVFEYDAPGWLHKIRDFTNREVVLEHDSVGNILSIATPTVTVFPPDVAATPYSARTEFTYSPVIQGNPDSGHNITHVVAPTEAGADPQSQGFAVPYVVNTWDAAGKRVMKQVNGGTNASGIPAGGAHYFAYDTHVPPILFGNVQISHRTAVVDANGYVKLHLYDDQKRLRMTIRYTGALDHTKLSASQFGVDGVVNMWNNELNPILRLPAIGSQEPAIESTVDTFEYNNDNLVVAEQTALVRREYIYDSNATDRSQKANLLISKQVSLADPRNVIVRAHVYEPLFNQQRIEYDPRAFGDYAPPNGGIATPDRYSMATFFDYQEEAQASIQTEAAYWGIDLAQSSTITALSNVGITIQPVAFGLGDVNEDGQTSSWRGQAIATEARVSVLQEANQPTPSYEKLIVRQRVQYNAFGLPVALIDPAGFRTHYTYFPVGSAAPGPDDPSSAVEGGFLASVRSEVTLGGTSSVTQRLGYDVLGRLNRFKNGRGASTLLMRDEMDRVVIRTNAQNRVAGTLYDRNGNVAKSIVEYSRPTLDPVLQVPDGGSAASRYITTSFTYDILDNLVQKDMQIDTSGTAASIKYRYDKNQSRVLTLYPMWASDHANVESSVFDEFGQIWTSTKGGVTAQFASLQGNQAIPELAAIPVDVPDLTATRRVFYEVDREVRSVDAEGRSKRRDYDEFNRLVKLIDPLGHFTRYTLDVAGSVVLDERVDVSGASETVLASTEKLYDELGRVFEERLSHFDSAGVAIGDGIVATRQVYDVRGNVTALVDDNLKTWMREYDGLGRLTREDDAIGNHTLFQHDANGNVIYTESHEFDSDAPTVEHIYKTWMFHDELDRLTATTNTLGHTTRAAHDTKGRVIFQSDARSSQVGLSLSSLESAAFPQHSSLPSTPQVNGHGNTVLVDYDDTDYLISTTAHQRVDGLGGSALLAGPGGQITSTKTYDLNGRLAAETDDHGSATSYGYDALNRRTKAVFADLTEQRLEHYKDGRLKRSRDANGTWIDYEYDGAGRPYRETATPAANVRGEVFAQFGYDGLGRLVSAVNSTSTVSRQFDSLSRVTREVLNNRHTVISYSGVGTVQGYVYPSGRRVTLVHDDVHRLRAVQEESGSSTIELLEYAGRSRIKKVVLPNGTSAEIVHDEIGRVSQITHMQGAVAFDQRASLWDRQGNRTNRDVLTQTPTLSHVYAYDSIQRMTASSRTGAGLPAQGVTYQLDDLGNRNSVLGGPSAGTYTLTPPQSFVNEYTTTPLDIRGHDANGNLTSRLGTATLYYDYRNRLVEYDDTASARHHVYRYDALGRRVAKVVDQGTANEKEARYFYDGGVRVLEEQDPSGTTLATYVFDRGLDSLVSMRRDADGNGTSEDFFFHSDDMDNVVALTAATGAVVERYEYGDYGVVLDSQTLQPAQTAALKSTYLFNGRELDAETGLYYFRNRYFEPEIGRFITRDPLGMWADAHSFGNGYTYCGNNPWSMRDPLGLTSEEGDWRTDSIRGDLRNSSNSGDEIRGDTDHHGSAEGKKGKSGDLLSDPEYQQNKQEERERKAEEQQRKVGYINSMLAELNDKYGTNYSVTLRLGSDGLLHLVIRDGKEVIDEFKYNPNDKSSMQQLTTHLDGVADRLFTVAKINFLVGALKENLVSLTLSCGLSKLPRTLKSVWDLRPFERGRAIERILGATLPSNFPTIDRFVNGIATSIKSIDLNAKSYQNVAELTSKLNGYVDDLAAFAGRTWGGVTIRGADIAGRELVVAIPPGSISAAQQAALTAVQDRAKKMGVSVYFKIFE